MALESTQPLTEMSTRNLPGGKGKPARKADNLTAICESIVWKMWDPRRHTTLWAFTACYGDSFILLLYLHLIEKSNQRFAVLKFSSMNMPGSLVRMLNRIFFGLFTQT
jgi:hypothetical protein